MGFKTEQLKVVLEKVHSPTLAKEPGMVYQVWEDGEITLQKSGDLLWQRTLHCIYPGLGVKIPPTMMPERVGDCEHGYAFVTEDDAKIVRDMIENLEDRPEWNPPPKPVDDGPLQLRTYTKQEDAELVKDYLIHEFPMCRDGKIEVVQPKEGYWADKGVWVIQFPKGHDYWANYKNTLERIDSAAGDFLHGYEQGYKQGQRDADHATVLSLSKAEISRLAEKWATEGEIDDAIHQVRDPRRLRWDPGHQDWYWSHEHTKAVKEWLWNERKLRASPATIRSRARHFRFYT